MKYLTLLTNARGRTLALMVIAGLAGACGGGGSSSSPAPPVSPPPPPPPTTIDIDVALSPDDVVAGSDATGSGNASVSYNQTDAELDITLTLSGVTADTVTVRDAYGGATGEERFSLEPGSTAGMWQLSAATLSEMDASGLEAGTFYIEAADAANPAGALRGQILPPGIELERVALTPEQVTAGSSADADGRAWVTIDSASSLVTVHALTNGIPDADSAAIREAAAGATGPVVLDLAKDSVDDNHWLIEQADFTAQLEAAASAGELYLVVATPAMPEGAIRGQALPEGMELVVTDLAGEAVVMGGTAQAQTGAGRAMTTITASTVTSHVNLFEVADADAVELRQAPAGQNGPVLLTYTQDDTDAALWSLVDTPLNPVLDAALASQTLYVNVTTPAAPEGIARGQIVTAASQEPADETAFVVLSIDPPNAAEISALPTRIDIVLNREPLAASVGPAAVSLEGSGGDGEFEGGNEIVLVPASVQASGNVIEISLAGVQAQDDVYRVGITGGGEHGVVDLAGIPLDGDGDGVPGGRFEAAFELLTPEVTATLSEIQETIFTPSCAVSGCHTGSNPPDGLDLSAGVAFSNIVNVPSVQMPELLRIEPGEPNDSYLVRKVEGSGIVANRMPLGAAPLSQAEIDLIRAWVADGAPDN